jgi:hypothetical protein
MVKCAPLWLDLAVPPVPRRLAQERNHLIVCGDDALAYRVVEELTTNYGERVTVLLSARARGHGPLIARLPGVRVIERPELDGTAFADAGARSARAIALMGRDDLANFHAALRAQDVSPGLRLVMRIFNTGLGERMRSFFPDCAVLSSSSMAAPSSSPPRWGSPLRAMSGWLAAPCSWPARAKPAPRTSSAGWTRPGRLASPSCSLPARARPTWCSPWPTALRATR